MPALLTLSQRNPGSVATVARGPFGQIERGDVVTLEERLYFVLGFDPIGVPAQRVYLEDVETHVPRTAALAELAQQARKAVAA